MKADDWSRIEELYHAVLAQQPDDRVAFLSQACPSDADVRREVESLLAHDGLADRLLESPAWNPGARTGENGKVAPALTVGSTFGTYSIVGLLGVGGMGEVYRARDAKLHREVAIKVLPSVHASEPEWRSRFEGEARALASLNHPRIAAIHGLEESSGVCALVMELVEGPTLADHMARGPIPLEEALAIAKQVAEALDYAHDRGLVHRDLKPANIKITPDGVVKVLDFGLAEASQPIAAADASGPPTEVGVVLGTPGYMAPEQARGQKVDRRADIWAFGVILWEMLTGRQLFQGATVSDTIAAVLTREPEFDVVPHQVRRLLQLCLTRERRERLSNISTALVLLDERPQTAPAKRPRSRWLWPVATVLCLCAAAVLAFLHFREAKPEVLSTRFQVPLPANTSFADYFSISPDGRRFAVSARSPDGETLIWIHDFDTGVSRPVPNTNGGRFFFWSPDSRHLGFFMEGKLKRVDTVGGPPQTICSDIQTAIGGAWRSDGTILLGGNAGPLRRVSASGGTPTPAGQFNHEANHHDAWPIFLPDGRHILYHTVSRTPELSAVYVAEFRSDGQLGPGKQVVLSPVAPQYVPGSNGKGSLFLLRGETLFVQEFDERRLQTTGEPFKLLEEVGYLKSIPYFSVSRNGVLAWAPATPSSLVRFDPQGKLIESMRGDFGELALSPDGRRVAVSIIQSPGPIPKSDLSVIDLPSRISIRLTTDPGRAVSPVWSPDGTRVAYGGANVSEMRISLASGVGGYEKLLGAAARGMIYPLDWSRDGKYLLYQTRVPPTGLHMAVLPMNSPSADRKQFDYLAEVRNPRAGQFSPDGRFVAYVADETGLDEVYVQQFPAAGGKWRISDGGGSQPRWKGDEIFFLDRERALISVAVSTRPTFRKSAPRNHFPTYVAVKVGFPESFTGYDMSPDGSFLVNSEGPAAHVSKINVLLNWQSAKH